MIQFSNSNFLGLKTIVNALFLSMKPLSEVLFIMIFLLVVIALIGLQSYMGVLRQKCVENAPANISHEEWYNWVQAEAHTMDGEADTILCGNSTGAGYVQNLEIKQPEKLDIKLEILTNQIKCRKDLDKT